MKLSVKIFDIQFSQEWENGSQFGVFSPYSTLTNLLMLVSLIVKDKTMMVQTLERDPFVFQAVKLTSSRTQLPYEYYSLPFCKPKKVFYKGENLGECTAAYVISLKLFKFLSYISINIFVMIFFLCVCVVSLLFIGEVLRGDRIVNTLYNVEMSKDKKCELVCEKRKLNIDESKLMAERIQEEYYVHL